MSPLNSFDTTRIGSHNNINTKQKITHFLSILIRFVQVRVQSKLHQPLNKINLIVSVKLLFTNGTTSNSCSLFHENILLWNSCHIKRISEIQSIISDNSCIKLEISMINVYWINVYIPYLFLLKHGRNHLHCTSIYIRFQICQ